MSYINCTKENCREKIFVLLHITILTVFLGCSDESISPITEEQMAKTSTAAKEIACIPQEPINEFPPMFIGKEDIVLEPPDDIVPDPETNLPFVAPVKIPRGTLFIWHDDPTQQGKYKGGGANRSSFVPIKYLNIFGDQKEYHVRTPDNRLPFHRFSSFRDDRIGEFHGRYFIFRYGRPKVPDVTAEYIEPNLYYPFNHKSADGEPIPSPDQFAVVYEGKIYSERIHRLIQNSTQFSSVTKSSVSFQV